MKPEEMKAIVAIIKDKGKGPSVDKAFGEGLHVDGERFVAFNIDDRHIYGRKVCLPSQVFSPFWLFALVTRDSAHADRLNLRI